jgi:hypothetical protein
MRSGGSRNRFGPGAPGSSIGRAVPLRGRHADCQVATPRSVSCTPRKRRLAAMTTPQFEARHVTKVYPSADGSSVKILRDVSITVDDGEFVAIVGPSGSVKSTLLYYLAGLEPYASGSVLQGVWGTTPLMRKLASCSLTHRTSCSLPQGLSTSITAWATAPGSSGRRDSRRSFAVSTRASSETVESPRCTPSSSPSETRRALDPDVAVYEGHRRCAKRREPTALATL